MVSPGWNNRHPWFRRDGRLSALFLIAYAIARIAAEFFREPDSPLVLAWLTKGQALSLLMFVGGAYMLVRLRRPPRDRSGQTGPESG